MQGVLVVSMHRAPWSVVVVLASTIGPIGARATAFDEGLDEAKAKKLFSTWDRNDSPGCAVAVVREGRVVFQAGFGMADLENDVRITPETVFNVGSMAKQFTAMCVALLIEQKKISLEHDVRAYVPELPLYAKPVTVRHLLHHTSGLPEEHDLLRLSGWRWEDPATEADILDLVKRHPSLNFEPGEEYQYSNTNYLLLAIIVKRVSGLPLTEFAEERIFKPLGMTSTRFVDDHDTILKRRARGHISKGSGFAMFESKFNFVGPSSVYSTIEDLVRWDANFYTPRVGTAETIALARTPGRLSDGTATEYGFGLELATYRGLPIESHSGSVPGFRAELLRFPKQRCSVAVLSNLFDVSPTALARQLGDIYLSTEYERIASADAASASNAVSTLGADELVSLSGLYWNEGTASSHRLVVERGQLQLQTGEGPYSLTPVAAKTFRLTAAPRRFDFTFLEPNRPGSAPRVRMEVGGQKPMDYVRVDEWHPGAGELTPFCGEYVSDEGLSPLTVALEGARLQVRRHKYDPDDLRPVVRDAFQAELLGGIVRFLRGGDGRVIALTLTTERTRRIRFRRVG